MEREGGRIRKVLDEQCIQCYLLTSPVNREEFRKFVKALLVQMEYNV
jgi:hypothetical protein